MNATLTERVGHAEHTAEEVPRGYIRCNAQYTGCFIVPKREAHCIEGTGLSCGNCYDKYLPTQG